MKPRVINDMHLQKIGTNSYLGYTSELKKDLFYGFPEREWKMYIQYKDKGNRAARYELDPELDIRKDDRNRTIWIYRIVPRYAERFPEMKDSSVTIIFDQINKKIFRSEKQKKNWIYGKRAKKRLEKFKEETDKLREKRRKQRLALEKNPAEEDEP